MKRGDLVVVAMPGEYGKPLPAVVVQADRYVNEFDSIIVCPLTTTLTDEPTVRVIVAANAHTGLKERSSIMIEKIIGVPRNKVASIIGHVDEMTQSRVDFALSIILGLR
jgi:mRNA interferase MazF